MLLGIYKPVEDHRHEIRRQEIRQKQLVRMPRDGFLFRPISAARFFKRPGKVERTDGCRGLGFSEELVDVSRSRQS